MASILHRTTKKLISNPISSRQLARFCSKTDDLNLRSLFDDYYSETLNTSNFDKVGFKLSEEAVKLRGKTTGGHLLVITDPRTAPQLSDENPRDIVQAQREISRKERSRFGVLYQLVGKYMKESGPVSFHNGDVHLRDGIVEFLEKMRYNGYLGIMKDAKEKHEVAAVVAKKMLPDRFPEILLFHSYKIVGNLVILNIDYDRALDALVKLLSDRESEGVLEEFLYCLSKVGQDLEIEPLMDLDDGDKNNDLDEQEKLAKMIQEQESKNKGMPLLKRLGLLKGALMLYLQHAYDPVVGTVVTIVEMVASQIPWPEALPKESVTLKACEQGLLIVLDAPGFKTTDSLKVRVEKESLIVDGGAMTTIGYKPMHVKVKIPSGHVYDQDQVVADLSHGQLKILFPFASHNEKVVGSFAVKWGHLDLEVLK